MTIGVNLNSSSFLPDNCEWNQVCKLNKIKYTLLQQLKLKDWHVALFCEHSNHSAKMEERKKHNM